MSGHAEQITEESVIHDAQTKRIGKHMGKLYSKEYTWFKKIPKSMIEKIWGVNTQACEPDGGSFWFDGLPQVTVEGKFQGQDGQAGYALEYEKLSTLSTINPNLEHIMFCAGKGCISKSVDGKTKKDMGVFNCFAHNLKVQFDNRNLLNTYVYQSPNGFTDKEMMDIIKKHLDAKRGLTENIVRTSPISLRGVLDV
tara:strand:- start:91 stop:678 length:588 start_codon:yes stop_codon:yes gene_type:complete